MTIASGLLIAFTIFVGLAAAYIVKHHIKHDIGDNLLVALVAIPTLLILAASAARFEFEGFGIKTKIERTAEKKVSSVSPSLADLAVFSLTANDPNFAVAAYFEACADYFVVRPSRIPTDPNELNSYVANVTYAIRSSIVCGKLQGVVILDDTNSYLGMFDANFFAESLSIWVVPVSNDPVPVSDLASRIGVFTTFGASLKYPVERIEAGEGFKDSINENSSLVEVFNIFQKSKKDSLPVVDRNRKFKGLVSYRNVVDALLAGIFAQ